MLENFVEKLVHRWIEYDIIKGKDQEIYRYGIRQMLIAGINICSILVMSCFLSCTFEALIFMMAFVPLRCFAGGFHARTAPRCYVISCVVMLIVFYLMKKIPITSYCHIFMIAASVFVILIFAPIGSQNKKLDEMEKQQYKKITRIILLIEFFVILIDFQATITISVVWAIYVVALLALCGKIQDEKNVGISCND